MESLDDDDNTLPPPRESTPTTAFQCLLFVANEGETMAKGRQKFEGYVLFSQKAQSAYPKVCELFKKNRLQIMNNEGRYTALELAIRNDLVSIIEMLVTDSNPEPRAFVETQNRRTVDRLIDRNDILQYEVELIFSDVLPAVDEDSSKLVEHLVTYNPDIKYRHSKGGTFLHLAVNRGDENLVRLLLKKGASLSFSQSDASTALHLAALRGHEQIFRFLLSQGASLYAHMKGPMAGATPFHVAAANGHAGIVKLILEEGASIDAVAFSDTGLGGATALHMAVEKSHCEVVKLLLERGANVNAKAFFDTTALLLAVEQGCSTIVESILQYGPDVEDPINERAFRLALTHSNVKYGTIVTKLIKYGFTIKPSEIHNKELLHGAIHKDQTEVVRTLLVYGANVNEMYGGGISKGTPLHTAARHAKEGVLRLLLQYGADINAEADQGKTPIMDAFYHANPTAIRVLLESNASMPYISKYLLKACAEAYEDVVKLLLRKGANPNVFNARQETTLFIAAKNPHIVQDLLSYGAEIDVKALDGRTPLHEACANGNSKVAEILLRNGADLEAKCLKKRTPIFYAVQNRNLEVIKVLGRFGARVDVKDEDGNTPLHFIVDERPFTEIKYELVASLLNYNLLSPEVRLRYVKNPRKTFTSHRLICSHSDRAEPPFPEELSSRRLVCPHSDRHEPPFPEELSSRRLVCPHSDRDELPFPEELSSRRPVCPHSDRDELPFPEELSIKRFIKSISGTNHGQELVEEFVEELSRHYDKMKAVDLLSRDSIPKDFRANRTLLEQCLLEAEEMKSTNIGSSSISYFDVLTSDELQVARYVRNEEIVHIVESDECPAQFPIFADILRCQLEKGILRKSMVDRCVRICDFLFREHDPLPDDVKERILSYLSKNDLGTLTYACQLRVETASFPLLGWEVPEL